MKAFNGGKPFHGMETMGGKLKGATDTDYFYFFCPRCGDHQVLQIQDYDVREDGPVKYARESHPGAKRDFTLAFKLFCSECKLVDFVKVSNTGWQGGKLHEQIVPRRFL